MKIIGISGLENSISFKRANSPGRDEREYRISQGHDAAAALVIDGETVAAAAQERFDRKKHSSAFPLDAISYCLREANLALTEIDEIVHSFDYRRYRKILSIDPMATRLYDEVYSPDVLGNMIQRDLPDFPACKVRHISHHDAHAASAWLTSGWPECLVVVLDGMGEVHSGSVYEARGSCIRLITQFPAQDSIGILYSLVTLHLGFDFNADEYKIMGLAPYGNPARFRSFFETAVELREDGSIRIPALRLNATRADWEFYAATREFLRRHLGPEREPDEPILEVHRDIAAALQECLNRSVQHVCGSFARRTGLQRLAMAGGVALNCSANGHLAASGTFSDIYIQPAAGDDGSALGAALARSLQLGTIRNCRSSVPLFGPAYGQPEIESAIRDASDSIEVQPFSTMDETCRAASHLIREGKVVAWFRGRMEFGPRALGNRSILADPAHPEMRDRINAMVKKREAFRPFAPAVSLEQVHRWFDVAPATSLPYMIQTVPVRREYRSELPAITHVDGSARVQTVSAADNPPFHALLKAVGSSTGREMLLNTSFNVKGQPIVNTPAEAIETFLTTGIDFLFLENVLIKRRQHPDLPS